MSVTRRIRDVLEDQLATLSLDDRIAKRVDRLLDEEVNRRVDQEFKKRLAALAAT
ncbi:hypothetical protein D3C83_289330 [compost metagenome]